MMLTRRWWVVIVLISLFCTIGCGPTEEDVMESIEIITDGFSSVPFYNSIVELDIKTYGTAETSIENDTESIQQNVLYSVEGETLFFEGNCIFIDYFDEGSGYTLNGKITYDFEGNLNKKNYYYFEYSYDFGFDIGKVKTIKFSFNSNENRHDIPEIIANRKK